MHKKNVLLIVLSENEDPIMLSPSNNTAQKSCPRHHPLATSFRLNQHGEIVKARSRNRPGLGSNEAVPAWFFFLSQLHKCAIIMQSIDHGLFRTVAAESSRLCSREDSGGPIA